MKTKTPTAYVKSFAPILILALFCAAARTFQCPAPVAAQRVSRATLAPQLKAQPEIPADEISEDRVVADVAAMVAHGERPFIVMDKDGTITLRNIRIQPQMAEHIVNLLAHECRMVLLSANVMSRIKPEFVDILISDTLPALNKKRAARGQAPFGPEIFGNLIVCTNAKVWEFDAKANDYKLRDSFTTDPVYYRQVKAILNIARNFFISHPRYKLESTSHTKDIDGNLKLAAMAKPVSREKRRAFIRREQETSATLGYGYGKKLVWILVLQDLLYARVRNEQETTARLLENYAAIIASDEGRKQAALKTLLDAPKMAGVKNGTLARFMLEMLEIMDGECCILERVKQRMRDISAGINTEKKRLEDVREEDADLLRGTIADLENLYDYWREMVNDIENPQKKTLLKHRMAALVMARAVRTYRGGPADGSAPPTPFVEDGGDFAVNVNFRNKGQRIDMLIKEFNVPAANASYLGDELYPTGGDATAFESKAETFINAGDPMETDQILKHQAPTHLCNPPGKTGPPAIERIFGRFLEILESDRKRTMQSAA